MTARRAETVRSLAVLGGGTALAAVLGLGFQSLLAYWFGASAETDAFFMSLSIYGFLAKFLMLSHLRSLALPVYARLRGSDPERARSLAGGLVGLGTSVAAVLSLLLLLGAPFLVDALAPGYQGEMRALTVRLVRIIIPALVFLTATTVAMAFLESEQRFGVTISAQKVVPAAASLALLLVAANRFGIAAIAWIDLIATIAGALLILPVVRRRLGSLAPRRAARDPEIRSIGRRWASLSSSNAATFVGEWAFRVGASLLPAGLFSAVLYGRMVHDLLHGAINDPAQTMALPRFATAVASERAGIAPTLRASLAGLTALSLPLTLLVAATAPWTVALLFGRGRFLADGMVRPAAVSLSLFMVGFFLQGIVQILFSASFATQRSDLINRAQLVGHLARAAALVPLVRAFSYVGLVGAQIGMNALVLALFVVWAPREWGLRDLGGQLWRPLLAALVPAALYLAFAAPRLPDPSALGTLGRFGVLSAIGAAWLTVYAGLAWALRLPEAAALRRLVSRGAMSAAVLAGSLLVGRGRAAAQSWAPVSERDWTLGALEWAEARGAIPVGSSAVRPLPINEAGRLLAPVPEFAQRFAEERRGSSAIHAAGGLALEDGGIGAQLRAEVAAPGRLPFGYVEIGPDPIFVRGGLGWRVGHLWLVGGRERVRLGGSALGAIVLDPSAHLDGVHVGTAAPVRAGPLGDVSVAFGAGPLCAYEAVRDPWWGYLRVTSRPAPWLQLGVSRAALAGGFFPGGRAAFDPKPYGPDAGSLSAGDVVDILLGRTTQFDDQVAALDLRVAWARFGAPLVTYAEVGWEDWDRSWGDPGLIAGVAWALARPQPITLRYEYAAFGRGARVCGWCDTLPAFWYQHVRFQSGWRTRDELLGHPLGGYGHRHAIEAAAWLDRARLRTDLRWAALERRQWNLLEPDLPGSATRVEAAGAWRPAARLEVAALLAQERGDGWKRRSWRIAGTAFF